MVRLDPRMSSALRWFVAATVAGLILGAIGPFGSYLNPGPALRFGYWVTAMWLGLLLYGAGLIVTDRVAPPGSRWRWPVLILTILVASVPEAALTRIVAFRWWPVLARVGPSWLDWYTQTTTIALIATIAAVLVTQRSRRGESDTPTLPVMPPPSLAHGDVLALQMEDHYVRVHTPQGSELVLMPLGRAIASTRIDGLRVHRSWWVASHAVAAVEGTPRTLRLHLTNGIIAPVSRSAVARVRAAGWIAPQACPADG